MDERRRVTRRTRDFDVTCYIDGAKLEAHVMDISRGGVFVRTDSARPVPVGALAGIVFVPDALKIATTFMFGRVVRRQDAPVRGFAVRWEKAVSAGRPEELTEFLKVLVDMVDVNVEQEVVGTSSSGGTISRCVYRFPENPGSDVPVTVDVSPGPVAVEIDVIPPAGTVAVEAEPVVDTAPPAEKAPEATIEPAVAVAAAEPADRVHHKAGIDPVPVVAPTTDIFSCLNALEVSDEEVSEVRITSGPTRRRQREDQAAREPVVFEQAPVSSSSPAAPFRGVDEVLIPCRQDGSIFVIDASVPVLVTALGQSSAVVRSRFVPVDDTQPMTLVIIIGTRRGDVPVRCHGRVTVIERGMDSGFRMAFSSVEEGDSPGVLERYLKWLEFNAGSPQ